MTIPAFTKFDPRSFLENEERRGTAAKPAKGAKGECEADGKLRATLASLATLAGGQVEIENFELTPGTRADGQEERTADPKARPVYPLAASQAEITLPLRHTCPKPAILTTALAAAQRAGVQFLERVSDGSLIPEDLDQLAPNDRQWLEGNWDAVRNELLPDDDSTDSLELLTKLNVEPVYLNTEERAAAEVQRLCKLATAVGIDVETAPRSAFLPVTWPIAVTKDGRRSKMQVAMDTSAALDPFRAEVRLLQVAAEIEGRMMALVIDLRQVPLGSAALAPLWQCTLVGHNLSFDVKMLAANGVQIADANLVDTILMAGLVLRGVEDERREGSRRPSLADAVHEALGLILPKTSQLAPWWRAELSQEQIAYAALDAVFALKLADELTLRISALGNGSKGNNLQHRLCAAVGPVARMELAGVTLDRGGLSRQIHSWKQELVNLRAKLGALGIANPSSAREVATWLRRELERLDATKLASWPRTTRGNLSTRAKHLQQLAHDLPGALLLVQFSHLEQLRSNFGDKLLNRVNPQTGRLHGSFQIAGAKTGRFSSSNPNLQNIPKLESIRSVFVAAPGKQLVVADYSQLELRVMAHISNDPVMTEAYRNGRDLHAITAASMLGVELDDFDVNRPVHKEARQKAKAVNFGIIYGSGPSGIKEFAQDAYNLQITVQEARAVIHRFLTTYRGVARWQQEQEARIMKTGTVSTRGGRVYRLAWEAEGRYYRNLALNLPIQGTAAEIAIEALIRIEARLRAELPGKAQLVLQVHDEFVVEADEIMVLAAKRILKQEMSTAFEVLLPGAPTRGLVEAHAGATWAAAKG
jgi:DNA polymerase I-like protein with 3'-5' exonuclease and polymerase domains